MMKAYYSNFLFFIAFLTNASFSVLTDFLISHYTLVENLAFYYVSSAMIFSFFVFFNKNTLYISVVLMSLAVYLFALSLVGDPLYGSSKVFLGLVVPCLTVLIVSFRAWSRTELNTALLVTCMLFLIVAVAYKLQYGLFQRSVRFGLLGSITFGWVMTFGVISALLALMERRSMVSAACIIVFVGAVLWSGSKGPLISLLLIAAIIIIKEFPPKKILLVMLPLIILGLFSKDVLLESRAVSSILVFADDPAAYISGSGSGSVGSRLDFYKLSLELFWDNPVFGVGFGGWGLYEENTKHFYPHNIFLEVMSEAGLLGFLLLLFLLSRVFLLDVALAYLVLMALAVMLFSGDFSYLRYPLFFLLLGDISLKCGRCSSLRAPARKYF